MGAKHSPRAHFDQNGNFRISHENDVIFDFHVYLMKMVVPIFSGLTEHVDAIFRLDHRRIASAQRRRPIRAGFAAYLSISAIF